MRGGISEGPLYHDSNYIFGPAFIAAYDLECKKATFPRIICDTSLIQSSQKGKARESAIQDLEIFTEIIRKDNDDFWYIDYIENIEEIFNTGYEHIDYLIDLGEFIRNSLNENKNEKVLEKYEWMKEKYNLTVNSILKNEALKQQNRILYNYCQKLRLIHD